MNEQDEARRQQAEIDAEEAATRRREAAESRRRLEAAQLALAEGDAVAVAEAAAALHRTHAEHEARDGRLETARESLARALRAERQALLLRGRQGD